MFQSISGAKSNERRNSKIESERSKMTNTDIEESIEITTIMMTISMFESGKKNGETNR